MANIDGYNKWYAKALEVRGKEANKQMEEYRELVRAKMEEVRLAQLRENIELQTAKMQDEIKFDSDDEIIDELDDDALKRLGVI